MPSSKYKYRCLCKAIKNADGNPEYSAKWLGSKRATFKVFDNEIVCGSWSIPFDQIRSATLFKTKQWFIPVEVLRVVTETNSYQFGFNPWANPTDHMNFPISEEHVRLGYSTFSIWQRRYWEHHIRNTEDYRGHIEYCWRNPVKHGLVDRASDWPYSSFHRDVKLGRIPLEWT